MAKTIENKTKTIENKVTSLMFAEDVPLTYAHLLTTIVNKPIKEGITTEQMRTDIGLLDKFEKAADAPTIKVTEKELEYLVKGANEFVWGVRHKEILGFIDYIDSLK